MTTHSGAATTDTKGTDSTATDKSEVQSIVATMSQSVSMLAQSMLQAQEIQAQQTRLLLGATQGMAKIPKLEQKTCARPTVKATMAWVRAVADVQYAVPGLTAALEALMRHPHAIDREDFVDAVDEADDVRIFTKVKGSMLDVYKNMVAVTGQAERVSAMGLIYDTLHYALKKPDAWLVMKLDWLMNKVKPMNKGEDLKTLFEEWHGVVVEVEHSGSAGSAAVYDSLEVLMSRFGPQYNRAVRDSKYKDTQPSDMERLIVAMSQQVEVLAEQFPVEKLKPRDTRKKKEWTKDRKPTGAAESRAPKGEAKEYKKPSKESMQCYEFALTGKCTKGADCRFRHDKDLSRKVMLALQEKMATAQMAQEAEGDEGERWVGYCGVEADPDPDSECEINPSLLRGHCDSANHEGALSDRPDSDWYSVLSGKQGALRDLDPNRPWSDPTRGVRTLGETFIVMNNVRARVPRRVDRQVKKRPAQLVERAQAAVQTRARRVQQQGGLTDAALTKVLTKSEMTKAPSYEQHMAKRQRKADTPVDDDVPKMRQGPVVDTGAQISVVCKRDCKCLQHVVTLPTPVVIKGAVGQTTVDRQGVLKVGAVEINKVVMLPESPESVVAMRDLARQGYTLVQEEKAAGLVKGDKVIELVPALNGCFRLPTSTAVKAVGVEVQRAIAKYHSHRSERERMEALSHHVHCHMPTCPGCPECLQAKMQRGDGVQGPKHMRQQMEMGFDLMGPLVKSPDGNTYKLVGVATATGVGWAVGLQDKTADKVLEGVKVILARTRLMHTFNDDVTVRFHSDLDKSFMGAVEAYAKDKAWLKTSTEGYDSDRNARVENRNKKIAAGHRAILLGATGGRLYYEELWDVGMDHMADMANHLPEAGHQSPAMLAGGDELGIEDMMEAFGAAAYYYEAPERRQVGSKQTDTPGCLGVWVGRSHTVNGGHRIVPLQWNVKKQQWNLGKTLDRAYAVVNNAEFPLRKVPATGGDINKFEEFVHRMSPSAMVPDVYVVDKVVDMRIKQGEVEYRVKWQGYTSQYNTWEPEAHLLEHGAQEAVSQYRAKHPQKVGGKVLNYMVLHLQEADDDAKAVESLMRQHKLGGTIAEWLPGYKSELSAVIGKRCREITGDEYIRVMKTKRFVKLRMNPEPKKDGRKKWRLLVKGYMEPAEWTGKSDSPTVMASTIKMLIAMGTDPQDMYILNEDDDVLSIGDVTTAFLLADDFGPDEIFRVVGYKAHKGAKMRLFQLLGPLYGQRDAGYRWWETLSKWLISQGFVRSANDKCLFSHPETRLRVAVHVDDIIVRGSMHYTKIFWAALQKEYALKNWEVVDYDNPVVYTGYTIGKVKKAGKVWYTMDMANDIADFLTDTGVDGCRGTTAPMPYKEELTTDKTEVSDQEHKWFRSVLGSLAWYTNVRYDIAYEVNRIAQYSSKPTKGAMKALRRVLAYLSTTRDAQLMVPRVKGNTWHIYSDSDHAGEAAAGGTTRSHTGVMVVLNGMPVHWRSNKQPKTALSSAAAEIYAMSAAIKDANLRMWIAEDMNVPITWPMKLHVDNAAGVAFQHSTCGSSKLQGVFNYHEEWVQELKDEGKVNAVHVSTDRNLADMLTKGLKAEVRHKLDRCLKDIAEEVASGSVNNNLVTVKTNKKVAK